MVGVSNHTTAKEPDMSDPVADQIAANIDTSLNEIQHPAKETGDSLYGSTKIFPELSAENGESYLTLVHGIPHESSVTLVAILQATRALRKGFESVIYLYGPGTLAASANRGFPTVGTEGFPGETSVNGALETFLKEGGTVFACRFGLGLHGIREEDLIAGIVPAHPLDVQDALVYYAGKGAIINSTYNL